MSRGERALVAAVAVTMLVSLSADLFLGAVAPPERLENPGAFLSNGWYCLALPGDIRSVVTTTNLGDDPMTVRRRTFGGMEESESQREVIQPRRRAAVDVADFGIRDPAVSVETFGSDSVSDTIGYAEGVGVASPRCTLQPSDLWFFGMGSTQRGRDTWILVANPFDEEAVVEVRVITPSRDFIPQLLSDVVIPPLSQELIFLPTVVGPEEVPRFGFRVRATRGRVVVGRYQRITRGRVAIQSDLGAPATGTQWFFPGGEIPRAGNEHIVIVNPSDQEALVRIVVYTQEEVRRPASLEEIPVPAGRQVSVNLSEHLERGLIYGASVTSFNDVAVVVERETDGAFSQGSGVDSAFPVRTLSDRWVLTIGSPVGGADVTSIVNFGAIPVVVRITLIFEDRQVRPPELSSLSIDPGRKVTIDMTPYLEAEMATAVIEALTGEVGVESRIYIGGRVNDFADSSARR